MRSCDRSTETDKIVEHIAIKSPNAVHDGKAPQPHAAGSWCAMAFQTSACIIERAESLGWSELGAEQLRTARDQISRSDGMRRKGWLMLRPCRRVPRAESRQFDQRPRRIGMIGKRAADRDPDLLCVGRDCDAIKEARP